MPLPVFHVNQACQRNRTQQFQRRSRKKTVNMHALKINQALRSGINRPVF